MSKFYAIKASCNEVRLNSSSGGFFQVVAQYFLKNEGVVYGAVYDDNFRVVHSRADNFEDVKKMSGSKYSQSFLGNSFERVKKDLVQGKMVLFTGTPCQINSLYIYLKDDFEKLYTIDVVCHGTPKSDFLLDYIKYQEKKFNSKVININMRYKSNNEFNKRLNSKYIINHPVDKKNMYLEFKNGKKYVKESSFDIYYQLFDYFINKGCFSCKFANLNRISDFTMGDFHEFHSKLGEFNDGNGISLVILNNKKAELLFNKIKHFFNYDEKRECDCLQPALERPTKKKIDYDEFHNDYKMYGFNYISKKYGHHGFKYFVKKTLYNLGLLKFIKK